MTEKQKTSRGGASQRGAGKIPSLFDDLTPNKAFPRNSGENSVPLPENLFELGFGSAYGAPRKPQRYEMDLCRDWIDEWTTPRKTIYFDYGSYLLKHVVERWSGVYIPNGAFIAAAIESGCKFVRQGPNARFNISYKLAKKNKKTSGWTW